MASALGHAHTWGGSNRVAIWLLSHTSSTDQVTTSPRVPDHNGVARQPTTDRFDMLAGAMRPKRRCGASAVGDKDATDLKRYCADGGQSGCAGVARDSRLGGTRAAIQLAHANVLRPPATLRLLLIAADPGLPLQIYWIAPKTMPNL